MLIDSTIVRAHQHSAAARKADGQEIGRSRGGLTTKLHVAVDALGNPVRVILTAGQIADVDQAEALIKEQPDFVVADKGYAPDALVETITAQGSQAVIPPPSHRLTSRPFDRHMYKSRYPIEVFSIASSNSDAPPRPVTGSPSPSCCSFISLALSSGWSN